MRHLVLLLANLLLVAGCAPTMAPHAPYLPTTRHRGEAEAHLVSSLTGRELELQLGYQANKQLIVHTALLRHERPRTGKSFRSSDFGIGYYPTQLSSRNWRLGLHGGVAYGQGASGGEGFCLGCRDETSSVFETRYRYVYLQPTALFASDDFSVGFGVRVGRTRYDQMRERRRTFGPDSTIVELISHDGLRNTFVQPMTQLSFRVKPWLLLSGGLGVQVLVSPRNFIDNLNPFVGQLGLHVVVGPQAGPQP